MSEQRSSSFFQGIALLWFFECRLALRSPSGCDKLKEGRRVDFFVPTGFLRTNIVGGSEERLSL